MEKTRSYSGLFIIDIAKQDKIGDVQSKISSVITDNSGSIVKENLVGKRNLAYPINKKSEGLYYEVDFTALPEVISEMTRLFRINTDIVRATIDVKK